MARIAAIDKSGPRVNSVIETNPDALDIAEALDQERNETGSRGPLHGIPVLIKDNIETGRQDADNRGVAGTGGCDAAGGCLRRGGTARGGRRDSGKNQFERVGEFPLDPFDQRMERARRTDQNPYALDRNPCGSSSGSGGGISANLAAVGMGTETDGSIVCPSSANGVVGIKPTVGLVSRRRIIPISHTQDTAGPMCRTVRDAAILLGALTGVDPNDGATAASEGKSHSDYTQFLDADGLRGARIGVLRKAFGFNPAVDKLMESALEVLKKQGATLVDPVEFATAGIFGKTEFLGFMYELKADLNAYLAWLGPTRR